MSVPPERPQTADHLAEIAQRALLRVVSLVRHNIISCHRSACLALPLSQARDETKLKNESSP